MRVLDLTDDLGAAAIRALVGLGADVVRVPAGAPGPSASELHWYAGTRVITAGHAELDALAMDADVVIESGPRQTLRGLTEAGTSRWPDRVHVVVTPFGLTGPRRDWRGGDLVTASAGGMTWLGGRPDGPPKPPPRESALQVAGAHAAIAAYLGLLDRRRGLIDVSVQQAVAATLETGAVSWIHAGAFPRRSGGVYAHVAARIFRAADGYVAGGYSGPSRMWTDLLAWMDETGEAEDLTEEKYADAVYRWTARPHVDEVVARFTARRTAAELGEEGRRRALPWAEVSRADQLVGNPQLESRGFFITVGGLTDVGYPVRLPPLAAKEVRKPIRKSLAGLRVLDLTWVLAGPYATRQLADFGADVIKVESRHRQDPTRFQPSMRMRPGATFDDGGYFLNFNRGKRSIAVNMRLPEGQALVRRLARECDVIIDNYSPGTMAKWGLDHASLSAANPDLIAVSMSGVGQTGPWRNAVTFADTLAAMSGLTHETADPGGDPQGLTFGLGDMVAANAAVLAVLAMLAEGRGGFVDLSQLETMAAAMGPAVLEHQLGPERTGATPSRPHRVARRSPHGVYPARGEDRWVAIAVDDDAQWRSLARLTGIGTPGLSLTERKAAEDHIDDALAAWTSTRDAEATAVALQNAGVPAAVVATGEDLVERDPQLAARGFYPVLRHPIAGEVRHEGGVIAGAGSRPAPLLGEHTTQILEELLGDASAAEPAVLE
ncbi:CoA transferase [Actinoplanes sp. OR16]|uniref:CaiB/BaiF CoA-transferase family protein n=1 Tax=Actinoplanes sp. OR16 TaxID=946334 RepID=UPI000F71CD68|nr:CoA transferase [Actinoplanes sp. OR16]BBH67904.1 CoA transferase [Actinoplanes sp. OR16]